jgi:NitT/TauT family transport system substrate-binding protein
MRLVRAWTRNSADGSKPRRPGLIVASLAMAMLAAGCSAGGSSGADGGGAHITVAIVPGLDTAPLEVAVKHGLFGDHGLDVSVQTYSSVNAVYDALNSGKADIGAGDYTDFLYHVAFNKAKLRLVADAYDATTGSMELMTLPGSNKQISKPQDLVGKNIATPTPQGSRFNRGAPYNIETLATESVLQADGLSPSSVHWKPMPEASMLGKLRTHQVSAILVTEPYITEAETRLGATEFIDSVSGVTASLPLSGYFASASFADRNPDAVRAFQAALNTAQSDAAQRGTLQSMLVSDMSKANAALVTVGQYPTFLSIGQVQRVADLMYDSGMIFKRISIRSLLPQS